MRRGRAFLTPPQFSCFLRPGNRLPSLSLPPLASSLADATPPAPVGLRGVSTFPASTREHSYRSALTDGATPIVDVGVTPAWDAPTGNADAASRCGLPCAKPIKGDDIHNSLLSDAGSITTELAQTSAVHERVCCAYRTSPLRVNWNRGQSTFHYLDLTTTVIPVRTAVHADNWDSDWCELGDDLDSSSKRQVSRVSICSTTSGAPHIQGTTNALNSG